MVWFEVSVVDGYYLSFILYNIIGFFNDLLAELLHNFVVLSVALFVFIVAFIEINVFKHTWVTLEILSTLLRFIVLLSFSFIHIFDLSFCFSHLKYILHSNSFNFLNLFLKVNNVAKYFGGSSLFNFFIAFYLIFR